MTSQEADKNKIDLFYYNGVPLPEVAWAKKDDMIDAINYKAEDDDIILCSFPKTGTTWLTYIVWEILHKDGPYLSNIEASGKAVPSIDFSGLRSLSELKKPRFYKHHLPFNLVTANTNAKYIYIYRNPEDTVASLYHFLKDALNKPEMEFDFLVEAFMKGEVPFGSYFDHVLSFESHRSDGNIYFLSYEDLKTNTRSEILKIAKFIGNEYYKNLIEDESYLDKVIEVTGFDYMKKNVDIMVDFPDGQREVKMFRKGIVGDGKNHLSEQQISMLRGKMLEKMRGTRYVDMWSSIVDKHIDI